MKKLISIITSAVMTFCILSVLLSADVMSVHSANDIKALKAGYMGETTFDGITVKIDGDAIKFITKYEEAMVSCKNEICLSRSDDGYIFKPQSDGKYVVSIMHFIPCHVPEYQTFWFPPLECFFYEISISNGTVSVDSMHRLCDSAANDDKSTLIESFFPNGISFTNYTDMGTIFGAYFLLVYLSYNMDPMFIYYCEEEQQTSVVIQESLITSFDPDAEAYYIQGENTTKLDANYKFVYEDFPEIGKLPKPVKFFELRPLRDDDTSEKISFRIILTESKKTKIYDLDYADHEVIPSSLKVAECPENDINADESFNIADVVQLQTFLLGSTNAKIYNWRAADLNEDGALDVFDLVLLKKALINATAQ